MDSSLRSRRKAVPATLNMKNTDKFFPAMTLVQRPISSTTDFFDTEFEDSESETESPRMSMDSIGYDSNSTLSTPDLPTPDNAPREPFTFQSDKLVRGPSGPHLFRSSIASSSGSSPSTAEIDLYFERSPVNSSFPNTATTTQFSQSTVPNSAAATQFSHSTLNTPQFPHSATTSQFTQSSVATPQFPNSATTSQFSQSVATPQFPNSAARTEFSDSTVESTKTSNKIPFSPCTPKALATLHPDVSQVEEAEIRNWSPGQVAHWLHIAGYDDSVIEKFIINDISGAVLLNLQIDDLKELSIHSFGKRYQVMGSINHLRDTMLRNSRPPSRSPTRSPRRRSYEMSVSPTGEVISQRVPAQNGNQITPAESVSIVGIEQVLPKPHSCSKGENCSKYRKRQRQLERLAKEFPGAVLLNGGTVFTGNPGNPETAQNLLRPKSDAQPSVVASSDIFGPAQETPRLCEEMLNEVQKLDPQESIRHFLNYQHIDDYPEEPEPIPEITTTLSPPAPQPSNNMTANLRNLPKLTIPADSDSEGLATANAQKTITPGMANQMYGSPTTVQEYGPFTGRYVPSGEYYRQGTPFSEMDVPITAIPNGPVSRETSQSVPPDMRYGNLLRAQRNEPLMRSASTRPGAGTPLRRVHEGRPLTPIENPEDYKRSPRIGFHAPSSSNSSLSSDPDVTRSGYMKKRKTTRFLRHDWQDAHFTLRGTNLAMHKDEIEAHRASLALDSIDVDDYAVACSSLASSSKLSAAFKRSILHRNGQNMSNDEAAFAFSLIPSSKENEKKALFGHKDGKSHHFSVKTRDERIDWMRELMLAKALKKGREGGGEVQVNGNFI